MKLANAIAFDIREIGRVKKINGIIQRDATGKALRIPGACKSLKAIGWYIEEYQQAQVSTNLTDINICSVHQAYEAAQVSAQKRGLEISGSELIGLIPKICLIEAGIFYAEKSGKKVPLSEGELIELAIEQLNLRDLGAFDAEERIIEFALSKEA